jgi:hypothetical protein
MTVYDILSLFFLKKRQNLCHRLRESKLHQSSYRNQSNQMSNQTPLGAVATKHRASNEATKAPERLYDN